MFDNVDGVCTDRTFQPFPAGPSDTFTELREMRLRADKYVAARIPAARPMSPLRSPVRTATAVSSAALHLFCVHVDQRLVSLKPLKRVYSPTGARNLRLVCCVLLSRQYLLLQNQLENLHILNNRSAPKKGLDGTTHNSHPLCSSLIITLS